jgi:hypothetical protein
MDGKQRSACEKAIEVLEGITRDALDKVVEIKTDLANTLSAILSIREFIRSEPSLNGQAAQGTGVVKRILILHKPDRTVVYFDDHKRPIALRRCRILVELLRALADPDVGKRVAGEGLVPFKSQEQLIVLIDKQRGNMIDKAALRAHVLRLRNELKEAGLDRMYIQTRRGHYRLRFADDGQIVERREDV